MEAVDTFEDQIGPLLQRDDAAQSKASEAAAKPASKATSAPKPKKRPAAGASDGAPVKARGVKSVPEHLIPAFVNHIRNNARLGAKDICTSFARDHDGEKMSVRQIEENFKTLAEKRKGEYVITAVGYARPDSAASSSTKARQHAPRDARARRVDASPALFSLPSPS